MGPRRSVWRLESWATFIFKAIESCPSLLRLLLVLSVLTGCTSIPAGNRVEAEGQVLHAWTQLGPDSALVLRAIVPADTDCPVATVDGAVQTMSLRAAATRNLEFPAIRPFVRGLTLMPAS